MTQQEDRTIEDFWYGDDKIHYKKIQVIDGDSISALGSKFGGLNFNQSVKEWSQPVNKQPGAVCAPRGDGERKAKLIYPNEFFYIPAHLAKGPLNKQKSKEKKYNAKTGVRCVYKGTDIPAKYAHVLFWEYTQDEQDIVRDINGKPIFNFGITDGMGLLKPTDNVKYEVNEENKRSVKLKYSKSFLSYKDNEMKLKNLKKQFFRNNFTISFNYTNLKKTVSGDYVWKNSVKNIQMSNRKMGFLILNGLSGKYETTDLFDFGNNDSGIITKKKLKELPDEQNLNRVIARKYTTPYQRINRVREYEEPDTTSGISVINTERSDDDDITEKISNVKKIELHCTLPEWIRRLGLECEIAKEKYDRYELQLKPYLESRQIFDNVSKISSMAAKYPSERSWWQKDRDNFTDYKEIINTIVLSEQSANLCEKIDGIMQDETDEILTERRNSFISTLPNIENILNSDLFSSEASRYLNKNGKEANIIENKEYRIKIRNSLCDMLLFANKMLKNSDINHKKAENEDEIERTSSWNAFEKFNEIVVKRSTNDKSPSGAKVLSVILDDVLKTNAVVKDLIANTPGPPSLFIGLSDLFAPYVSRKILSSNDSIIKDAYMFGLKCFLKCFIDEDKRDNLKSKLIESLMKNDYSKSNKSFTNDVMKNMTEKNRTKGGIYFTKNYKRSICLFAIINLANTICKEDNEDYRKIKMLTIANDSINVGISLLGFISEEGSVLNNGLLKSISKGTLKSVSIKSLGVIGGLISTAIAIEEYNKAIDAGDFRGQRMAIKKGFLAFAGIAFVFLGGAWAAVGYIIYLLIDQLISRWILGSDLKQYLYDQILNFKASRNYRYLQHNVTNLKNDVVALLSIADQSDIDGMSWRAAVPLMAMGFVEYGPRRYPYDWIWHEDKTIIFDAWGTLGKINKFISSSDADEYKELCPDEFNLYYKKIMDIKRYKYENISCLIILERYLGLIERLKKAKISRMKKVDENSLNDYKELQKWLNGSIGVNAKPKLNKIDILPHHTVVVSCDGFYKVFKPEKQSYESYGKFLNISS